MPWRSPKLAASTGTTSGARPEPQWREQRSTSGPGQPRLRKARIIPNLVDRSGSPWRGLAAYGLAKVVGDPDQQDSVSDGLCAGLQPPATCNTSPRSLVPRHVGTRHLVFGTDSEDDCLHGRCRLADLGATSSESQALSLASRNSRDLGQFEFLGTHTPSLSRNLRLAADQADGCRSRGSRQPQGYQEAKHRAGEDLGPGPNRKWFQRGRGFR